MGEIDFVGHLHSKTKRDYVQRVIEFDKAECATIASQFGQDYWDGDRQYGYGGYSYDGRWRSVADKMAETYNLKSGDKILDVGSGKGFLLYELTKAVPGVEIQGLDISTYGIENSKEEVKPFQTEGHAKELPWEDDSFDLVISLGALHNLPVNELFAAIKEIERVGSTNKWIMVESYRNEREKANLLYWQLTCKSFYSTHEWAWIYDMLNYKGDHGFIFFE